MSPDNDRRETADGPDDQGATDANDEYRWLVLEFAVPADQFLLASTLEAVPGTVVEFEQFVPADPDPFPCLWTTDDDREGFERAVVDDSTVERADRIAGFDGGALYEIEWARPDDGLLGWLRSNDATVLQSESLDGEWLLKLRLPSRAELGDLREYCRGTGIDFRLVRLFTMTEPKTGQYDLSEKQQEVLVVALEMGYFEIPRGSTLDEIASRLGISSNSASERLRRAQTNLLSNTVTIGQPRGIGIGTGLNNPL